MLMAFLRGLVDTKETNWTQLCEGCVRGDTFAQSRLVELTRGELSRQIRKVLFGAGGVRGFLVSAQDIEDILQDTYMEVFRTEAALLRRWDPIRSKLLSFLAECARRNATDFIRRGAAAKRRNPYGPDDDVDQRNPEQRLRDREKLVLLERALTSRLTDTGRLYYRLLYVEEMSVEEICQMCHTNRDVVYQWRKRLADTLKAVLRELEEPN